MKVGVLGTGQVGQTLATELVEVGHEVRLSSRDAANENATKWASSAGEGASNGTFADAAAFGEIVFDCTAGTVSLAALELAGDDAHAARSSSTSRTHWTSRAGRRRLWR